MSKEFNGTITFEDGFQVHCIVDENTMANYPEIELVSEFKYGYKSKLNELLGKPNNIKLESHIFNETFKGASMVLWYREDLHSNIFLLGIEANPFLDFNF